jgi:hypothetical protein
MSVIVNNNISILPVQNTREEFVETLHELFQSIESFSAKQEFAGNEHFNQFCKRASNVKILSGAEDKIYRKYWTFLGTSFHYDFQRGKDSFYGANISVSPSRDKKNHLEIYFLSFLKKELKWIAEQFKNGDATIALEYFNTLFQFSAESSLVKNAENAVFKKLQPISDIIASDKLSESIEEFLKDLTSQLKAKKSLNNTVKKKYYVIPKDAFLERVIVSFRKKGPLSPVDTNGIPVHSERELLNQLFARYQGICVGEYHDDLSSKEFLFRNMDYFKAI